MALIQLRCPSCQALMRVEQGPSPTAVRCPSCSSRVTVPGVVAEEKSWFYAPGNRQKLGPVSFARLQALAASEELQPTHMVLEKGQQKWAPARSVPGLFPAVADPVRTDAESELRGLSAPAGEERRTGGSLRQGAGWLLLQGREVAAATFSRTACLLRFALARWRASSPRRRDLQARHALGRRLYESGLGDTQTRAEIAALDGQASGSSTKEKRVGEAERTSLLLRLADHSLAAEPQDAARAEHAAALAARAELSRHEEELGRRRAALATGGLAGWLRAGAGYAALGCVVLLGSVLILACLPPRGASSNERAAGRPGEADETGETTLRYWKDMDSVLGNKDRWARIAEGNKMFGTDANADELIRANRRIRKEYLDMAEELNALPPAGVDPDAVELALRYVEHCRKVGQTYMEGVKNLQELKDLSARYESADAFVEAFLRGLSGDPGGLAREYRADARALRERMMDSDRRRFAAISKASELTTERDRVRVSLSRKHRREFPVPNY